MHKVKWCDNVSYKYRLTALCISVVLTCESLHAVAVYFTATLHTYMAITSTHLHLESWSNPALSTAPLCSTVCCVSAKKYFVQAVTDIKLFIGCLSNCICQASPAPQCIPSASCFVLSVLSLSPQKQKWLHGSFLQLLYCSLVRHHGISKEQNENMSVLTEVVFLCGSSCTALPSELGVRASCLTCFMPVLTATGFSAYLNALHL